MKKTKPLTAKQMVAAAMKYRGACGGRAGCKNQHDAPHPCPYREEIYDDKAYECTCCDECRHECAMDI